MSCINPSLRLKVEALSEDQRYAFEERAAIIEHDGGMYRAVAEQEAWKELFEVSHAPRTD